jgi:hypothetical protein
MPVATTDLIGFTQAGAGAVQRSAQSKLRESVNILDYAPAKDGVTDDTAKFTAAFADSHRVVSLSSQIGMAISGLALDSYQSIIGDCPIYCQFVVGGTDDGIIIGGTTAAFSYDNQLRSIRINGDTTGTALFLQNVARANVDNIRIDAPNSTAVKIGQAVDISFSDSYVRGALGVHYTAVQAGNTVNEFRKTNFNILTDCFRFDVLTSPIVCYGCTFDGITNLIHPSSAKWCMKLVLDNCWIEGVTSIDTTHVGEIVFRNCTFSGAPNFTGSNPIRFENCVGGDGSAYTPGTVAKSANARGVLGFTHTNFSNIGSSGDRISLTAGGIVNGQYSRMKAWTPHHDTAGAFTNLYDSITSIVTGTLTYDKDDPIGGTDAARIGSSLVTLYESDLPTAAQAVFKFAIRAVGSGANFEFWNTDGGAQTDYRLYVSNLTPSDGWYIVTVVRPIMTTDCRFVYMRSQDGEFDIFRLTMGSNQDMPLLEKGQTTSSMAMATEAVHDASAGDGSATLIEASTPGFLYSVGLEVTEAFDGDTTKTYRLGDGSTDDLYLGATTVGALGSKTYSGLITGNGEDIVLTWANNGSASTGELTSTVWLRE